MLSKWLDNYINTNIHVALAVVSLVWITGLQSGIEISLSLSGFAFFSTILVYTFVKNCQAKSGLLFIMFSGNLFQKSVVAFSLAILPLTFIQLRISTIETALILGLLTMAYGYPIMKKERNLRSITGLKIFIIAFIWSGVTVWLPFLESGTPVNELPWLLYIQRYCFVIVITLPFDIRDLAVDSQHLKTIPQLFEETATQITGAVLLFLFIAIQYLIYKPDLIELIPLILIAGISFYFIKVSPKSKNTRFASFWVESTPILWLFLELTARAIRT